jgi:hypothetical protein
MDYTSTLTVIFDCVPVTSYHVLHYTQASPVGSSVAIGLHVVSRVILV